MNGIAQNKENIMPLASGRISRVIESGSEMLQQPGMLDAKFLKKCGKWEQKIRTTQNSSDPLKYWIHYVRWIRQADLTGSHTSKLVQVLEKATRLFQNVKSYHNDQRYIYLWVHLIQNSTDSRRMEMFDFMMQKGIGKRVSLFYSAYAIELEQEELWDKAKTVYETGIREQAVSLSELEPLYSSFISRYQKYQASGSLTNRPRNRESRPLHSRRGHENENDNQQQQQQQQPHHQTKPLFSVFGDVPPATSEESSFTIGKSNLSKFPTEVDRTKENRAKCTQWSEAGFGELSSSSLLDASATPQFQIFIDEDCSQSDPQLALELELLNHQDQTPMLSAETPDQKAIERRKRIFGSSYSESTKTPTVSSSSSLNTRPIPQTEGGNSKRRQLYQYDSSLLVDSKCHPVSFEEQRLLYFKKMMKNSRNR